MLSLNFQSPEAICRKIAQRAKAMRLAAELTQQGLADRAGVSLGSLKRFEHSGAGSLSLVVSIAFALRCEDAFESLFKPQAYATLDEALDTTAARQRKRGTKR